MDRWTLGDFEIGAPNGETPKEVEERARKAINQILNQDFDNALVVAHGRFAFVLFSNNLDF
jgi:broad specificity phosphatase PhoE